MWRKGYIDLQDIGQNGHHGEYALPIKEIIQGKHILKETSAICRHFSDEQKLKQIKKVNFTQGFHSRVSHLGTNKMQKNVLQQISPIHNDNIPFPVSSNTYRIISYRGRKKCNNKTVTAGT